MIIVKSEMIRFLLVGATNTCATYLVYLLLLMFMHYNIAYSITFVLGICFSFLLNSRFVFKVKPTLKKALSFPVVYVVQYLLGLLVLHVVIQLLGFPACLGGIAVVVVSVPVTYMLSRIILARRRFLCLTKEKLQ